MRYCIFISLFVFSIALKGQIDSLTQVQINKDVWYNFMQSYADLDASLFNQIHTEDVIRVMISKSEMLLGKAYKDQNLEVFNNWNSQRLNQMIEFSFLSRTRQDNWAYETGIFKLTRRNGLRSQSFYGQFSVILQKVNGIWKIKSYADSSKEGLISETDFLSGQMLLY
jgi:hypothetical protein